MKKQNLLLVLLLGMLVSFSSCEKKSLSDTENGAVKKELLNADKNLQTAENVIYFLDDIEVSKTEFEENKNKIESPYVIQTERMDDKTGTIISLMYLFTTERGYIEYGDKHNLKLKEELEFASHMREYAEKTGTIKEYEQTGKVPEYYTKYEAEYYNKVFGDISQSKILYILYDNNNYSGDHIGVPYFWMLATLGSMKNRVSSVIDGGTGGVITFYDRTFFRRFLTTHVFTPFLFNWKLSSSVDNRAESVVTH